MKNRAKSRIKLKNNTRAIIIVIALVLFAFSSRNIYSELFDKKQLKVEKEIYNYTNEYALDYVVNIKENDFIPESSLPKDQTYVSDLIENLEMNIDYKYNSSENSQVKYNYKVDAQITGSHSDNGILYEVWNKTYNLKEVNDEVANQNININEDILIDFQKYHEEVKDFKQEMGMSLEAKLFIKLTVNTETTIDTEIVNNTYVSDFSITLGEKISKVDGENTDSNKEVITAETVIETGQPVLLVINILILLLACYSIYFIRTKTYIAYNIKNEFKLELNRILKSCQDRIVVVKNKVEIGEQDIIDVKSFVELIKLSEELFKPILYWSPESKTGEEETAEFYVISNKIGYRFILK